MKELTPMQAACLSGRAAHADLGKVAAHLYAEFDLQHSDLDAHVTRLSCALADVGQRHAAVRLRLTGDGQQFLDESAPLPALEVEDLRLDEAACTATRLLEKRGHWTHQQLDLRSVSGLRMGVTLLPKQRARLHVDADMIVIDPSSFRVFMEDFAAAYENVQASPAPGFLTWWDAAQSDPALRSARQADRQWWRARLDAIAPAPTLPLLSPQACEAESTRLHAWLDADQRETLQRLAREQRISLSSLMLGLFAATLAAQTGDRRLRLNVPSFWRMPLVEGVERIVGEFANVLIVDADLSGTPSLATVCQQMAAQLVERLAHSAWSGVDVMRELSRHCGSPQLAPVVFTAALDLPGGELFSDRVRRVCGELAWSVSQGPQVALDVQVAYHDGGILLNWDVRLDALPLDWVSQLFERYHGLLRHVAAQPEALAQPLPARQDEAPLRALQQAYLLGRGTQVPLGGVAMQEFREYHGQLDPQRLRTRLVDMLRRHPGLSTCIDAYRRVQFRATSATLNLDEIDLRGLGLAEARQVVDSRREGYAHAHFPLDRAPWNITLFRLPDAQWIVFARFDALIVDGRAIAALLVELLGDDSPPVPTTGPAPAEPEAQLAQREADAAYWQAKLAGVTGAPRLPWRMALEQIVQSRYARQRVRVPRQVFNAVARLGARQHLFKHATLTAVVLEVLSRWLRDGDLCVAMPVAAPSDAAFANRSSFLAVNWSRERGRFAERAVGLQQDVMEGLQHLAFSGVDLARHLFDQHGPGPVLPVVITNGLSWPALPPEATMRWVGGLTQTPQVALDVRFSNTPEGDLLLEMDYAREALDDDCIAHLLDALHRTLAQIANSGCFDVEEATVVNAAHYRLNTAETDASTLPFLARLAARLFDTDNHTTALISGEHRLSYAELGQAVAYAQAALAERGLVPGDVVAVCLPRSPDHTTLTLACALSGLVWVPIDAAAPAERRRYLLDNCRPALVVVQDGNAGDHPSTDPDALLAPRQTIAAASQETLAALSLSEAPAYYLYTSGTTGQPKCVVLNNRATANVIGSTLAHWAVTPQDVCLSVTPLHHDMSVFDVLGTLTAGATLALPDPQQEKDAQHWHALIAQHQVSLWCSVPAILDMLLACRGERTLASLRLIAQGGDYIKPAVISELRRLLPDARLISLGGPTETTIWSIWHDIAPSELGQIPYGHPLPGNRYLVLDDQGRHCPAGVVGRIHTTGVNLALGYLQDGTLSQQDFVTVTDDTGTCVRAFRTGDCGRYRADGVLLFDSRVNGYVKIRGVRVSLPDVEMALAEHPALRQVLVVDYGDARAGETCLGALYVGATDPAPSVADVRGFARQHLQQSHVPSRLIAVAALPLSQNGKPDRHRARHLLEQAAEPVAAAPAGHPVLDVYIQVLGQQPGARLDADTRFVDLGLRPQHLKPLAEALRARFDVSLSPAQLLRCRDARDVERLLTPTSA